MSWPNPIWDVDTEAYWQAAREHVLLVRQCRGCARAMFPPYPVCAGCGGRDLKWSSSCGRGHIYSWTVVHKPPSIGFAPHVPYALVVIEPVDFGVRIPGRLVDYDAGIAAPIKIGSAVAVCFEDFPQAGFSLPCWRRE